VLKPEDTIAGFKVVAIETSHVKLASPTNEIELRVGMQLRREEEGEWQLSERRKASNQISTAAVTTRAASRLPAAGHQRNPAGWVDRWRGFAPGRRVRSRRAPPIGFIDPQTGLTNGPVVIPLPPNASGAAPGGDVLEVLRRRAAAERGEAP